MAAASASFAALAAFASAAFFASGFGMNLNREIRRLNKISITNTVPIPIKYCTSTDMEVGVPCESKTYTKFASAFSNLRGTVTVY